MLPPRLASLTFVNAALGSDEAIAARTASAFPGARVLVLGASRPGLLRGMVDAGLDLVVVDSSRTALRRTREALGADFPALLLADDPRELTVPGGADAALVTSAAWRAVLLPVDRCHVLRALAGALRPGGGLALEVEQLPQSIPTCEEPVPGDADATWWGDATDPPHTFRVRADGDTVLFSAFSPDEAHAEVRDSGFVDVETDTLNAPQVWIRARADRGPA